MRNQAFEPAFLGKSHGTSSFRLMIDKGKSGFSLILLENYPVLVLN